MNFPTYLQVTIHDIIIGVEISNTDMYLDNWNLDLGAGNIFKIEAILKLNKKEEL